jgi:hypothetical protein
MPQDSTFVLVGQTLINVQTICAATLVSDDELQLWFPGSSQTDGPSFTLRGAEANELWAILKMMANRAFGGQSPVK